MFTVYILYSRQHKKSYVGYTSDLQERFKSHNELGKKGWTIKFRPWEIVHTEAFDSKTAAMEREKFFKSGQGRIQVKSIIHAWLNAP